jgi:TRAP-type uncharacterized transport system substrate-binding protein
MDAFPDYPRFGDKKVLSAIQIITEGSDDNYKRVATSANGSYDTTDKVNADDMDIAVLTAIRAINAIAGAEDADNIQRARGEVDKLNSS